MVLNKARMLRTGLGVFSTGGPLPQERVDLAVQNIQSLKLKLTLAQSPHEYYGSYVHGFANGSAQDRLDACRALLLNEDVDAILSARGATGSFDIIEKFPFDMFSESKKILIGDSDVTSLLIQMPTRAKTFSIHGTTFGASFADYSTSHEAKESVDALVGMLSDPEYRLVLTGRSYKSAPACTGSFLVGNLTMLTSLLGTPWDVSYDGCFLLVEEVGESPYRIERLLNQLYLAGKLHKLSGLGFGRLAKCEATRGPSLAETLHRFIDSRLSSFSYPVVMDLPFGHWGKNLPIPIGCNAKYEEGRFTQVDTIIS